MVLVCGTKENRKRFIQYAQIFTGIERRDSPDGSHLNILYSGVNVTGNRNFAANCFSEDSTEYTSNT
jgi:hypothetical protein